MALACYRLLRLILFWPFFLFFGLCLWFCDFYFFFLVLVPDSSFVEQHFRKSGFSKKKRTEFSCSPQTYGLDIFGTSGLVFFFFCLKECLLIFFWFIFSTISPPPFYWVHFSRWNNISRACVQEPVGKT